MIRATLDIPNSDAADQLDYKAMLEKNGAYRPCANPGDLKNVRLVVADAHVYYFADGKMRPTFANEWVGTKFAPTNEEITMIFRKKMDD